MKLLKNVLLKLSRGGVTDRVIYVDNLPEELLYSMQHPMAVKEAIKGDNKSQYWTRDTDAPKEMLLHEELKVSPIGDGGIVFNMENNNAEARWKIVDNYIKANFKGNKLPPAPVPYSINPQDPRAATLPLSEIPRIVLPVLSPVGSPTADKQLARDSSNSELSLESIKQQAIEEYKAEKKKQAKEKMAKARAARTSK